MVPAKEMASNTVRTRLFLYLKKGVREKTNISGFFVSSRIFERHMLTEKTPE